LPARDCISARWLKPYEKVDVWFRELRELFLYGTEPDETLDMPVQSDHEPVCHAVPFAQQNGAGRSVFFGESLDAFLDDTNIVSNNGACDAQ